MDPVDTTPRYTRIPCGCVFGSEPLPDGGKAFVYKPCSPDCEYYLHAQRAAGEQGKPLRTLDFTDPVTTRVPDSVCPACGQHNDAATDTSGEGATPKPGDWSMCAGCAAALVFAGDLSMRLPTVAEMAAMPSELAVLQRRVMDGRRR